MITTVSPLLNCEFTGACQFHLWDSRPNKEKVQRGPGEQGEGRSSQPLTRLRAKKLYENLTSEINPLEICLSISDTPEYQQTFISLRKKALLCIWVGWW